MNARVKPTVPFEALDKLDFRVGLIEEVMDSGYSDKIVPVLAVPEKPVPNGTRAG